MTLDEAITDLKRSIEVRRKSGPAVSKEPWRDEIILEGLEKSQDLVSDLEAQIEEAEKLHEAELGDRQGDLDLVEDKLAVATEELHNIARLFNEMRKQNGLSPYDGSLSSDALKSLDIT